ncbi:hypothetical protein RFI_31946, partial [Reticulomyxa filosa]
CPYSSYPSALIDGQQNDKKDKIPKINQVVNQILTKYKTQMQQKELTIEEEDNELIIEYLNVACETCWPMVLQDHVLSFWPPEFKPTQPVAFEDDKHTVVFGSNKKSTQVQYFVWPSIQRDGILLDCKVFVMK